MNREKFTKWKRFLQKAFLPKIWVIILLTIMSAVSLIWVFMNGLEAAWFSYSLYVLAFYTLMVLCIFLGMVLPKQCKEIKQKIYENSIGNRYMTDMEFRTHISLYRSLGVNLMYVGVNVVSYVLYRSWWFVVLAVYYMILAIMRFLLVRNVGKHGIGHNYLGELKSARLCSYILLSLNVTLSGAVLMILYQDKGYEYHGILIYVMALYTFYITTSAIVNLVKYRKYHSPVMTMTKVIALSAALVSMLSLETAMFSQFGQDMTPENKWLMIALTGAGVSMVVVTMSFYMIVRAHKEITGIVDETK